MKNLYLKTFNCLLTLFFLQTIFFSNSVTGQTIYKGDSVQLSVINGYRGTIKWQESVDGTIWKDIVGGTINNMWVKPLINTQFRAIVTENSCDPIYSITKSITISADTGLVVNTPIIRSFTAATVNLDGQIIRLGGDAKVVERGMCWSKLNNPTINDSKTSDGIGISTFSSIISGLTGNTTYYIRSYTKTDLGVVLYSNEITITTLPSVTISTVDASNIKTVTATAGGNITLNGTDTVIAKGVCWNTSQNPTIANNKTTDGIGAGTFSSSLTNLISEKIYYLKAYVTASNGITYYGAQTTFETLPSYVFSIQTTTVSAVSVTTANSGGTITMTGTGTVAARGICWSTIEMPTIADNKTSNGNGIGSFSSPITGLISDTTYYVRAYATSASGKTTYGNQLSFKTSSPFLITTTAISAITAGTANTGGNITVTTPGTTILARGVCFGTAINPTIAGDRTIDGSTAGAFASSIYQLKANTKYYLRAYAIDGNNKTSYGNELSFTTQLPLIITLKTTNPTDITLFNAVSGGDITTTGPGSVTERGVCISTKSLPTIENNKTINGTGIGMYTSSLSNLISGELFYIRAYATSNSGTTTYGNEITFNTLAPINVVTGAVSGIGTITANIEGSTALIDKNRSIKARGFCWSTSANPTVANAKSLESVIDDGLFGSNLTGLNGNTTYYVRAYVISESDIVYYGNQATFKTLQPFAVSISLNAATAITKTTATVVGSYSSTGSGAILSMGIAYSTDPNPTYGPLYNWIDTVGSTFSYNFASLLPGTTYYVRAYAITNAGLRYSNAVTFRTVVGYLSTTTMLAASELTSSSTRLTMSWNVPSTEVRTSSGILVSNKPNVTLKNYLDGSFITSKVGSLQSTATTHSWVHENFYANTTYYARSFIRVQDNIEIYSNEISFKLLSAPTPTLKVNTLESSSFVTENTASPLGQYSAIGGMIKTGFCYSISPSPTVADNLVVTYNTGNISIIGGAQYPNFSGLMYNLLPSTKYYYRAYACDQNGALVYGNILSLTTLAPSRTFNVNTPEAKLVEATSATLGWNVFSPNVGASRYTRGVCYSMNPNPTMADFMVGEVFIDVPTASVGVIPNTTYYARAFAYDPVTMLTHYGNQVTFTTRYSKLISLELIDPPLEATTTSFKNMMTVYGEENYSNPGFCYSTTPTPTINNSLATNVMSARYFTNAMTYFSTTTGLTLNTTYYVRGYAQLSDNTYAYSNELVFKTPSIKIQTLTNGASGGLTYTTNNRITNYGSETVVQRGVVFAVATDDLPTLSTGYYSFEGSGFTDFTAKVNLPRYSTRYFIRAYAKTNSGQVVYGNTLDYTTIADPNPPPPVTICTGCTDPNLLPPPTPVLTKGSGYLVFGKALGPAISNCNEGSAFFDDWKGYATRFVEGDFTSQSYTKQRIEMDAYLRNNFPGAKNYSVEFSCDFSPTAKAAVIIEYTGKVGGWDCYPYFVTIGYGSTQEEALIKALERKNNNFIINGNNATYKILKTIKW